MKIPSSDYGQNIKSNQTKQSIWFFVLLVSFFLSSCSLISQRETQDHCAEQTIERFVLERKTIQESSATIRVIGEAGKRVDGMDGRTEAECRNAGFKDTPYALSPGLEMRVFMCEALSNGSHRWQSLVVKSDIDEIKISHGDWLIRNDLAKTVIDGQEKWGVPAGLIRINSMDKTLLVDPLPEDWQTYDECGENLLKMTETHYNSRPIALLEIK